MDVCPSCGALVEKLRPDTGWCDTCTDGELITKTCVRCSKEFQTAGEYICVECKTETWANEIEELLAKGISFSRARSLVAESNQAICLCCGQPIPHATKGRHLFCSRYRICRRARRRIKYFRYNKGFTKEDAIQLVLAELEAGKKASFKEAA